MFSSVWFNLLHSLLANTQTLYELHNIICNIIMADADVDTIFDLLKEWGFEYLSAIFKEHEIDREALLNLTEEAVKEIIPKIGPRTKFMVKLKNFQLAQSIENIAIQIEGQENAISEPSSTDSEVSEVEKLIPQYIYSQKAVLRQPFIIVSAGVDSNSVWGSKLLLISNWMKYFWTNYNVTEFKLE